MDFLTLFISLRCTQACAHCLYGCSPDHGEHMPQDVFEQAVVIAKKNNIPALNFFGGEPLLNPQIFSMLERAFKEDFSLILATNCRLLADEKIFGNFLDVTERYKEHIVVFTATDRFHLEFFDPSEVIERLKNEGYEVRASDYSNHTIGLSEYNAQNLDLGNMNTRFSCCADSWTDYLGVLPDGGWTICPPSLTAFGNVFAQGLKDIIEFKRGLPLKYQEGCTECLKDFKEFRNRFRSGSLNLRHNFSSPISD